MRIILLGCGSVGSAVALKLAALRGDLEVILADYDLTAAEGLAARIGGARACHVDVGNPESLDQLFSQGDVVLNTVGPFYRTALAVIDAAIKAEIHYVDINDDHDVAAALVEDPAYDRRAKEADIILLIGCGATPGFTNMLAKLGADRMDRARSIRLCWTVPFLVDRFSPAVMDHLFHMLTGEVTQFIDGKHQKVPAYEGVREVKFRPPFGTYPAYFSGHGEPVTLGHFIPGLEEATIRSFFYPESADDLMRFLVRSGLGDRELVPELGISPIQFFTRYASSAAGRRALVSDLQGEVLGYASQVEVCGIRNGSEIRLVFEDHQMLDGSDRSSRGAPDPTAVCARLALERILDGEVTRRGFLAPEACIDPAPYIQAVLDETGKTIYEQEEVIVKRTFAPNRQ